MTGEQRSKVMGVRGDMYRRDCRSGNRDSWEVIREEGREGVEFKEDAEMSSLGNTGDETIRIIKRNKDKKRNRGLFICLLLQLVILR